MLSDANSSEVDQIVALAAVMRALIQPKPQGIKASELFNTRLIPTISQIATDKLYKSTLHVCTQCNEPNCSGAASARRHAAVVVLCGVVSSKEVMRLSLDWGLIIGGYTWLSTQNCVAKHRSVEGFLAAAVDKTNNHHQRKSMHLDYFHAAPNDTVTLAHRFLPFLPFLASLTP